MEKLYKNEEWLRQKYLIEGLEHSHKLSTRYSR